MERIISCSREKDHRLNPAWWDARWYQKKLNVLGSRSRIIGDGWSANLKGVLEQSLLGLRLPDINVQEDCFTPSERVLVGKSSSLLSVIDWDGVMGSPLETLWHWLKGNGNLKDIARVNRDHFRWLRNMTKASDKTVIWSSRLTPSPELMKNRIVRAVMSPFNGKIDYFPFFDTSSKEFIIEVSLGKIKLPHDKINVWTNKLFSNRRRALEAIVGTVSDDQMIYYVGSSVFDRRAAFDFVVQNPLIAPKFVFFDTAHLVL